MVNSVIEKTRRIDAKECNQRMKKKKPINDLEELFSIIKPKLAILFQDYGVSFAYLAGSWARRQQQWWSDVDIFIMWPNYEKLNAQEKLNSLVELNVKAANSTGIDEIDIRLLERQSLHCQFQIIREGIVIFGDQEETRSKYIEYLLNSYYDYIIWFNNYLQQSLSVK